MGASDLTCGKIRFYGAFVLNRRVDLHAIDATPARWRGDAGSSPLDGARTALSSPRNDFRVHPTHWLISTQVTWSGLPPRPPTDGAPAGRGLRGIFFAWRPVERWPRPQSGAPVPLR